jgi:hypothetical protein
MTPLFAIYKHDTIKPELQDSIRILIVIETDIASEEIAITRLEKLERGDYMIMPYFRKG